MTNDFASLGIQIPEILLPGPAVDLSKWAVIACDQYTSQPEYWEEAAEIAGELPSTLNLIFPEVYLDKSGAEDRIGRIHREMKKYLENGILHSPGSGFVYIERETSRASSRKGLLVALDLECYDYQPNSLTLIRATEETVIERIPPRVRIREGASIELPHIMVLLDDPDGLVIEPVAAQLAKLKKLYSTVLMKNGGRVTGYQVNDPETVSDILKGLKALADPGNFRQRYQVTGDKVLLFAVGDGNHSLATAKAVWEKVKRNLPDPHETTGHPARYALVELVNLHDRGLKFEPIHRVLFNAELDPLFEGMGRYFESQGARFGFEYLANRQLAGEKAQSLRSQNPGAHFIEFVTKDKSGYINIEKPSHNLAVGSLQTALDHFMKLNSSVKIDYIHEDSTVTGIGSKTGNIGFYLPAMDKSDLFKTIILNGVLPRKTFSMGEADEKRYYMECRKI